MHSTVVWRNEYGFTTRDHLFVLLEGREPVPDDVVDTLVLLLREELAEKPPKYNKRAVIIRPLALALRKMEYTAEEAERIVLEVVDGIKEVDFIFMPIIANGHYHLLVYDKSEQNYRHYSSLQSEEYDRDVVEMVSCLLPLIHE